MARGPGVIAVLLFTPTGIARVRKMVINKLIASSWIATKGNGVMCHAATKTSSFAREMEVLRIANI